MVARIIDCLDDRSLIGDHLHILTKRHQSEDNPFSTLDVDSWLFSNKGDVTSMKESSRGC